MPLRAVLFDFDGVIVDSEPLGMQVASEVLSNARIAVDNATLQKFVGIPDRDFYAEIVASCKSPATAEDLLRAHETLYEERLPTAQEIPGAKALISNIRVLRPDVQLAIVSGSTLRQITSVLDRFGLADTFNCIVALDHVRLGKPSPEGYLLAARKLGVRTEHSVVIEDSSAGVGAASAAGMACIALRHLASDAFPTAVFTVDSLNDLSLSLLEKAVET